MAVAPHSRAQHQTLPLYADRSNQHRVPEQPIVSLDDSFMNRTYDLERIMEHTTLKQSKESTCVRHRRSRGGSNSPKLELGPRLECENKMRWTLDMSGCTTVRSSTLLWQSCNLEDLERTAVATLRPVHHRSFDHECASMTVWTWYCSFCVRAVRGPILLGAPSGG